MNLPPAPPTWTDEALCADYLYPDAWFPEGHHGRGGAKKMAAHAIRVCALCPVRLKCLDYALQNRLEGVWGGLTDGEREAMRRAA